MPLVALPVSLISTFLSIYLFNFSINLFTLMALVLAIGIVVDDAIVMLENIVRRIELGDSPLVAADTKGQNKYLLLLLQQQLF